MDDELENSTGSLDHEEGSNRLTAGAAFGLTAILLAPVAIFFLAPAVLASLLSGFEAGAEPLSIATDRTGGGMFGPMGAGAYFTFIALSMLAYGIYKLLSNLPKAAAIVAFIALAAALVLGVVALINSSNSSAENSLSVSEVSAIVKSRAADAGVPVPVSDHNIEQALLSTCEGVDNGTSLNETQRMLSQYVQDRNGSSDDEQFLLIIADVGYEYADDYC